MTVGTLRRRLSAAEFTQWMGFYNHEAKMQAKADRDAR